MHFSAIIMLQFQSVPLELPRKFLVLFVVQTIDRQVHVLQVHVGSTMPAVRPDCLLATKSHWIAGTIMIEN